MLACGTRRATQIFVKSCHKNFPAPQIDKLLREVAEAVRLLQTNRIAGDRLRWTFEHAWIYIVIRKDGALATLVVDKQTEASKETERLLSEFLPPALQVKS